MCNAQRSPPVMPTKVGIQETHADAPRQSLDSRVRGRDGWVGVSHRKGMGPHFQRFPVRNVDNPGLRWAYPGL